ncbi:DUF2849 domain-containing protein [Marinibaculum pumilum]|uniref:DUF2849 domain-containing protein n=1 Tax=Marinibaculum pumilum TaxID=1766165 RepID=A0ABV7L6C6_9PROT
MQKGAKGKSRAMTANRLRDGLTVFLADGGEWVTEIDRAAVATDADGMAALEKQGADAEAAQHVVGAYLIDVEAADGHVRPLRNREQIRAAGGPTVPGAVADPGAGYAQSA